MLLNSLKINVVAIESMEPISYEIAFSKRTTRIYATSSV